MKKFGTGTAQKIWGWWQSFWMKEVRNQGIPGIAKGVFPFIIALVGTIIMGIIDAMVAGIELIGGLFNETDDDDARDLINGSSCEELRSLSDERITRLINSMLDGPTGDDDENAILKILGCLPCDRLSRIVNGIGVSNIKSEFHGSEFDELQVLLGSCGIISFSSWDDDASRLFINRSNCDQLNMVSDENVIDLIQNMMSGPTGDEDENAILKILGCLPCDRVRNIVERIGRSNLEDEFHGSEFDRLRVLLGNCGIISFSSWDDDASRLFINRSNCDQLNMVSDENVIDLIQNMMSGPTGDEDENAILKILGCLPCDRVRNIVERIGRSNLEDEFHGSEFDRLRVLLGNCGIISFSSWDDDASRLFIGNSDCATLNSLSLGNIMALLRNLFSGSTGDEDERAIVKLIQCLDAGTVQELISRPGFSKSDFDDEVDGSEWRALVRVFNEKGV